MVIAGAIVAVGGLWLLWGPGAAAVALGVAMIAAGIVGAMGR